MTIKMADAQLYVDFADYIQVPDVGDAFRFLVGIAATSSKFECAVDDTGNKRDLLFRRNGRRWYAASARREWLLFYFLAVVVKSNQPWQSKLARAFPSFKPQPNQGTEWTVELRSISDVRKLINITGLS